jgi:hypothetical protein
MRMNGFAKGNNLMTPCELSGRLTLAKLFSNKTLSSY